MKILMISQVFWPDTSSVGQHMGDLAFELQKNGHEIYVYTSRNAYEDNNIQYLAKEQHLGVNIERLRHTSFGKKYVLGRLCDFFTFNLRLLFKMLTVQKRQYDLIFGTTVPPLVSYIGVQVAKWKRIPFCYWTMDLQPELAIASGMIGKKSIYAKILSYISSHIIRKANVIFTLDNYMKEYLKKQGADPKKIHVVPVWPVINKLCEKKRLENPFRLEHSYSNKLVIMYSGNHSYVHPLDTLLQTAYNLKTNENILFVFIGGGVRKKDVTIFKEKNSLNNILQLPYQSRENIHNSLGSADIHVVVMGEKQVGFTHPNKIYGAMFIGKPILHIGPEPSHITDILKGLNGNISVSHGEVEMLTRQILHFESLNEYEQQLIGCNNRRYSMQHFHPDDLKQKMIRILENEFYSSEK